LQVQVTPDEVFLPNLGAIDSSQRRNPAIAQCDKLGIQCLRPLLLLDMLQTSPRKIDLYFLLAHLSFQRSDAIFIATIPARSGKSLGAKLTQFAPSPVQNVRVNLEGTGHFGHCRLLLYLLWEKVMLCIAHGCVFVPSLFSATGTTHPENMSITSRRTPLNHRILVS
jgi:hypothetical protein